MVAMTLLFELTWDVVLYNVAWGCLIGGGIITAVALILSGLQLGHALGSDAGSMDHDISSTDHDMGADHDLGHELGHDVGHDLSHDVSADHDLSHDVSADHDLSHDVSADHDLSHDVSTDHDLSHDVAIDHDLSVDHESPLVTTHTGAPLLLLLSAWFLWFGVLGVATYNYLTQREAWVGLITILPIGLSYLVAKAWGKIAQSQTYKVPVGYERLGEEAEVHRPITDEGGMVRVKSDSPLGFEVLPAKSLQALEKFAVGQKVYLCDLQKGFYLVSPHSKFIRRYRPRTP